VTSTSNFILAAILIYPLALVGGVNGVAWAMVISYVLSLCYLFYHVSVFLKKK
jgi:Na+-driven multidrug efflux pump